MNDDTLPLFDAPEPDRSYRKPKAAGRAGKPQWSRYRPKTGVRCDDCMAQLAETRGMFPLTPLNAKWCRRVGKERRLLCYQHAEIWRENDGMKQLKGKTDGPSS